MRRLAYLSLWLFVFVIPWENVATIGRVGAISTLLGLVAFGMGLLAVLEHQRIRRLDAVHFWLAAFVFAAAVSSFWSIDTTLTVRRIVTYSQLLIMTWLVWELVRSDVQLDGLLVAYVAGTGVIALWVIGLFLLQRSDFTQRYVMNGFDPNELALTIALSIPIAWSLATKYARHWFSWIFRLLMPLSVLAITLTGSRGAFVATSAGLLVVIVFFIRETGWQKLITIGIAVLTGIALIKVPEAVWLRLATIGSELQGGDLSYRQHIWVAGFEVWADHVLTGTGAGTFQTAVVPTLGHGMVAHNLFLSILADQGVVGLALFLTPVIYLLVRTRSLAVIERTMWRIVFLTWVVGVFTLTWEYRKPTWLIIGLLTVQLSCFHSGQRPNTLSRETA